MARTPEEWAEIFPDADPIMDFVGEEHEVINKIAERTGNTPEDVLQTLVDKDAEAPKSKKKGTK